jgi:hypothetical protein
LRGDDINNGSEERFRHAPADVETQMSVQEMADFLRDI